MATGSEYKINFGRLKVGEHQFDYRIDGSFFEDSGESLIEKCDTRVTLVLDKTRETLIHLDFEIEGSLDLACDRCSRTLGYPVKGDYRVSLKLVDNADEQEDDDVFFLSHDEYEFDISELLYEFHNLLVPMKKECLLQDNECRRVEEFLEGGQDSTGEGGEQNDPRWDDLKKLLDR